ncbi:MAG: hypothetical protein LBR38_06530 [Synergistaceae bacterium]|nr:hypothetical protein [Synergistaceae bacterium]
MHYEFGDSRVVLPRILEAERGKKKIFWLDAHYSGGDTFKNSSPLLAELDAINSLGGEQSVIFIDDARFIHTVYFGERYCEYADLIPRLSSDIGRYIVCANDAFIAAPRALKEEIDDYCLDCVVAEDANPKLSWKMKVRSALKALGLWGLVQRIRGRRT